MTFLKTKQCSLSESFHIQPGPQPVINMRKDTLYIFGSLALFAWVAMTYFLFVHRPNDLKKPRLDALLGRIQNFEIRLNESLEEGRTFLAKIKDVVDSKNSPLVDKVVISSTKRGSGDAKLFSLSSLTCYRQN
jgi:hypothetical protein